MSIVRIVAEEALVKVVEENQNLVVLQGAFDPNYGSFYDTTTQHMASTTVAQPITYNQTDFSRYVEIVDSSKIWARKSGKYNIQFSAQLQKSTGGSHPVYIWLRKNGTDVPHTNSVIVVVDGSGIGSSIIAGWNWFVDAEAGDEYQIMWSSDTTSVYMLAQAANTHPAIPSVILTVNQIG